LDYDQACLQFASPPSSFAASTVQSADFCDEPRLVTHVDDATIAALTDLYRETLPPTAILDR
jgi:hypothetical protein